jgi:ATP-dependent Lon protease
VLPIGGLKEKLLAAIRNGIEKVLLPVDNHSEWDELDKDITTAINVEFVENAVAAFAILFGREINLKNTSRIEPSVRGAKVR